MNAVITTGKYIDKQTGEQKKNYLVVGKLFIYRNGGMSLKLDAMPMCGQTISFYNIKPKSQPNQQQNQQY